MDEGDGFVIPSRFATANAMMFLFTLDAESKEGLFEALGQRFRCEPPDPVLSYLQQADAPMLRLFILRAVERLDEVDSLLPVDLKGEIEPKLF